MSGRPIRHLQAYGFTGRLTVVNPTRTEVQGVASYASLDDIEGDIDLNGILGLSDEVRNGYSALRVHFDVRGDASVGFSGMRPPGARRSG